MKLRMMSTGKENKVHIGIYGRRNVGKSSLINAITGQEISIVSDVGGTTTDPVKRSYEIAGYGSVVFIDTAGLDDIGTLGHERMKKTTNTLALIDLAIILIDNNAFGMPEETLVGMLQKSRTPFFFIFNKTDVIEPEAALVSQLKARYKTAVLPFSTRLSPNAAPILDTITNILPAPDMQRTSLLRGLVDYGDIVLLITPIDDEAPTGRLILPQVQTIRDVLDNNCVAIAVKENCVTITLKRLTCPPKLVVTDSQIFSKADALIPESIPLTSFSILLARLKGDFYRYLDGTPQLSALNDNDRILILESCSHSVSCEDIGRVKIPKLLRKFTGKNLDITVVAGLDEIPHDIATYALVIQCGGCVLTKTQIINRLQPAIDAGVPVTNYGMAIAYMNGIFDRAVEIFK